MFLTAPDPKQLNTAVDEIAEQEKYIREPFAAERRETKMLKVQHGSKIRAVISSDYVHTLDMTERLPLDSSLRSVEYKRARPKLTVEQYQEKNRKYKEEIERNKLVTKTVSLH